MLVVVSLGSLFCSSISSEVDQDIWSEKDIVSSDYPEEYYSFYLSNRVNQLIRKAHFLDKKGEAEVTYNCCEEAGRLLVEIAESESCYHHFCPYLVAALCFERSSQEIKELAKECYKNSYVRVLNHEFALKDPFALIYVLPYLQQAAYAAYLYGDEEAFAQLLYRQMELSDPFMFTWLISYMEKLQELAKKKFPENHWVIEKMQSQMDEKLLKELEQEIRETQAKVYDLTLLYNLKSADSVLTLLNMFDELPHP